MNLERGDPIEKENRSWIVNHLKTYEDIWSVFVGHDGRGRPLKIIGWPPALDPRRESFYQAHYTLLLRLLQLKEILSDIDSKQAFVPDHRAYMAIQTQLVAFLGCVGQTRDMFKKMDTALGMGGGLWKRFDDLYQNRCSFLHGTLPAQKIDDGILLLPDLAGIQKGSDKWNDESRWSDAAQINFEVAPESLRRIYDELLAMSRGALSECLTKIKMLLSQYGAHIEADPILDRAGSCSETPSGVQYFYSSTRL